MGYNLRIGEAIIDWSEDGVSIDAESVTLDSSPAFGEPTDHTNMRWPSYTSWAKFCRTIEIVDVMMNEKNGGSGEVEVNGKWIQCLMPTHPGAAPITREHLTAIRESVDSYKKRHPDHFAKFPLPREGAVPVFSNNYREEDYVDDPRYDGELCRAEWLLFWVEWALDNCERPVFVNS